MTAPLRIANCSGFYGDRLSAAREMVEDGPIDILTGDWLAELTMLLLQRDRAKDPNGGFAKTFLVQLRQVLGTCLDKGIRIVSNAGGMNPDGLADAVRQLAAELGKPVTVAVVRGDDLLPQLGDWNDRDLLRHLDTGESLAPRHGMPLAANAYLGAWGIVEALSRGADVVITGRTTDAAAVVAPAAWHHGWSRTDFDALAGALVAGHVIECGAQATGGNYSFFEEIEDLSPPGFPIAEIAADGSSVITKHEGTPGAVSIGTVTAQLLYEIGGPEYASPDVIARFDTIRLAQDGPDRVAVSGVRGLPPSGSLKAGVLLAAGWRNEVTVLLGGDRVDAKAARIDAAFWPRVGGKSAFAEARTDVIRGDHPSAAPHLRLSRVVLSAADPDRAKLGRAFTAPAIELALSSVPGMTLDGLPGKPRPCGVFWPVLVPEAEVRHTLHLGDEVVEIPPAPTGPEPDLVMPAQPPSAIVPVGRTRRTRFGDLVGARSGDKAGNANIGFWVREPGHWSWLAKYLTADRVRRWLGGFEGTVRIHPLPNLLSVNVEVVGWLGRGVASNLAPDPQAKCLAEGLRSMIVEVDESLLTSG
jgi:hypothetical protein